jgi:uncharacterized low-complexity protein
MTARLVMPTTTGSSTSAKPGRPRSRASARLMIADRAIQLPPYPSGAGPKTVQTVQTVPTSRALDAAPGDGYLVGMQPPLVRVRQVQPRGVQLRLVRLRLVRLRLGAGRPPGPGPPRADLRLPPGRRRRQLGVGGPQTARRPASLTHQTPIAQAGWRPATGHHAPIREAVQVPRLRHRGCRAAIELAGTSACRTGRPTLAVPPTRPAPVPGTSLGAPEPGRQVQRGRRQCGRTRCGRTRCGRTRCGRTRCGRTRCGRTRCGRTRCGRTRCGRTRCGQEPNGATRIGYARPTLSRPRRFSRRRPMHPRHRNGACTAGRRPSSGTTRPTARPSLAGQWTQTSGAIG